MAIPFLSWSTNPDGNRVASEAIQRAGAPTTSTVGMLGQNYINTSSSPRDVYTCVNIANGVYTWILNGQVTGIKGNSESTYRTGNVNITADNIGLGNVNNTADSVKNVLSATKLATARTINVSNGARGTAVSFNGENNISIPIDSVYASYLSWGGKGLTGIVAPVDIAMNNEFNANRLAFMTASDIVIEYSNDGGTTWTNYDTSDSGKIGLVTTSFSYGIGGRSSGNTSNDLLRITLTAREGILYSSLKEIQLQISTNGASGSNVTLEGRTVGNYNDNLDVWSIFVSKQAVAGWSGWNVLNYPFTFGGSSTQTYQHRQMRMTFGINAPSSSGKGLQVLALRAYGENLWSGTNSYQRTGHMYSFDTSQNVIFPARVAAPTFSGDLSGTATKATQDASGNIITSTYAPLVSPVFAGVPVAPTAATGTNTTQIATTEFVQQNSGAKVGDITTTVRSSMGDKYLLCNGDSVDPAVYPDLCGILVKADISTHNFTKISDIAQTQNNEMIFNGTQFVCLGNDNNYLCFKYSLDGISWNSVKTTISATGASYIFLYFVNNKYIIFRKETSYNYFYLFDNITQNYTCYVRNDYSWNEESKLKVNYQNGKYVFFGSGTLVGALTFSGANGSAGTSEYRNLTDTILGYSNIPINGFFFNQKYYLVCLGSGSNTGLSFYYSSNIMTGNLAVVYAITNTSVNPTHVSGIENVNGYLVCHYFSSSSTQKFYGYAYSTDGINFTATNYSTDAIKKTKMLYDGQKYIILSNFSSAYLYEKTANNILSADNFNAKRLCYSSVSEGTSNYTCFFRNNTLYFSDGYIMLALSYVYYLPAIANTSTSSQGTNTFIKAVI